MSNELKKFADDGWAIWIDGEDTSTVYINDWLNPKGNSYIDLAIRIRGIKVSKGLHVYVPFAVSDKEIEDVSLLFEDKKILQATFSAACIIEYKKNKHTSEIAYNGKTVDIVHISTLNYKVSNLSSGTLISVNLDSLQPFIDNDEAYFLWRMPHKSLDRIFRARSNASKIAQRLRDLITTPIVSENYGYSVRINEARLLPDEITRISAFHRQKLKKTVVTISVHDSYELNDSGCYRICRLEENVYKNYIPKNYKSEDVITYQWHQNRDYNLQGHFNFYYNISKNSISKGSMFMYLMLLTVIGVAGNLIAEFIATLLGL